MRIYGVTSKDVECEIWISFVLEIEQQSLA
jgi:hypothetical protein